MHLSTRGRQAAVVVTFLCIGEIIDVFENVSGNPEHYIPLSEYLFQTLRKAR
jgi:hypothetical protein